MKIHQEYEVQQFNRLYKEMNDIYHEIALAAGVSYVSKQTVSSSVRNLEKNGFLYLEKSGRDKHICLTEKGRQFVEQKIRPVADMENEAFLEMGPEERAELIRLSQKYVDLFGKKEKELLEVLA